VHEIYTYGGSLGEFFDKRYLDILEQQRKIEDLKAARDVAKGVVTCLKCGKTSPRGSTFCPKCGGAIGDAPEVQEVMEFAEPTPPPIPPTPPPIASPTGKNCNSCGCVNEISDRFCLSCGRII